MLKFSRRKAIQLGLAVSGSALLPAALQKTGYAQVFKDEGGYTSPRKPEFYAQDFRQAPQAIIGRSDGGTDYYEITMKKGSVEILPGIQTEIWGYNGITPGPMIRQRLNRQSVIRFINDLGTDSKNAEIYTSVHLHGSASLPQYDGWADDITRPRYYKDYNYPNNRAASIWYHDHGVHRTALNAYMGLAGQYIIEDPNEHPDIPKGEFDIAITLGDKLLDRNGQLVYDDNDQKNLFGDVILVNGVPWPRMAVQRTKYRFRLCNTGITRAYRLSLQNGDSLTVIGTDAGLLESPVETKTLVVGVAERYEFVVDFAKYPAGTKIELLSGELKNHDQFPSTRKIMRFDVVGGAVSENPPLPQNLRTDGFRYADKVAELKSQATRTREIVFERHNGQWAINGRFWGDGGVEANPGLGDVEVWRLVNNGGGWNHPIHIHLVDFLMIRRLKGNIQSYEKGWKDVFYLGEGQEIDVITKFGPHKGKYMIHCHNLVHEDHDMMRAFEVGQGGPDPVTTAPPQRYY
ncbi:MAG: multicopper oxidase family protein [Microcoleaceae cyanobacterium]